MTAPTPSPPVRPAPPPARAAAAAGRARRPAPDVTGWLLGAAVAVLAVGILGAAGGWQLLVVRSGSMAPAIQTGDAIVVRPTSARAIAVGDVITFRDRADDRLVTHRVRSVTPRPGAVDVVTRGDANTGTEQWSLPPDGHLGLLVLRIPRAGYLIALLASGPVRAGLVLAGAALLVRAALQRIWR